MLTAVTKRGHGEQLAETELDVRRNLPRIAVICRMAKARTVYVCQECGHQASKWAGRCAACGGWNTLLEEISEKEKGVVPAWGRREDGLRARPVRLNDINAQGSPRLNCNDPELNRVLGGGMVPGSVILCGGEPGIGKSTLLLQLALQTRLTVMYVSGEESEEQLKMRAERIGINHTECYILTETQLEAVIQRLRETPPGLLIVDSIQTLYSEALDSAPGSISQIRECAAGLMRFAKQQGIPVFLIGHINKDGQLAGPKILEHMVDTVLQFEGDRHHTYRILRTLKNRFGNTSEIGIYEMTGTGLRAVENPSEILISQRDEMLSGISIAASMEGMRPLLIETQALVSTAVYGTPQRTSTGYDLRRLNMLLAVLEKRCGFKLGTQDVFVNIAGGLRVEDPGMDLGIVSAILSSYQNTPIPAGLVFCAEVGLAGEIRAVNRIEQRIAEAEKIGFDQIVVSKYNRIANSVNRRIQIIQAGRVDEVFSLLFG
jgi:DNA repair protein RadA/Sms